MPTTHDGPKPVTRELRAAIAGALASGDWRRASDDAARVEVLLFAILDPLHWLSPVNAPHPNRVRLADRRERRNAKIRAAFNGRNYRELSEKFRLTTRQIRRITNGRGSGPAAEG